MDFNEKSWFISHGFMRYVDIYIYIELVRGLMKQLISGGREPPCTICTISICQIDLTLIFAISLMKVTFYLPIWQGL